MYKVIINKRVLKSLDKIPADYLFKIKSAVNELGQNPRSFGYIKMSGFANLYRIRAGIYRIIYTIEDEILTVKIVKIDHRSEVYN
jgi:mRNA interferase RelE/StbE